MPYTDPFYYSRRPTIAIPAANGSAGRKRSSGKALGLHPKLTGLHEVFNQGRLAIVQRAGYENSSRSHFSGTDIWSTGNPPNTQGSGWLGRYLSTLPAARPALRLDDDRRYAACAAGVGCVPWRLSPTSPATRSRARTAVPRQRLERTAAANIASHVPVDQPHVAFVGASVQAAMATLDRVASVAQYKPSVAYPNNGFGQALQAVAGAMVKGLGTRVFFVTTGGFDTHASQDPITDTGAYARLMTTLDGGLKAFFDDLKGTGLLSDTLVLSFSEFGRRISENGSRGTDHGAASPMLAMGGLVRGGLYGTAASLNPDAANPTLENNGADVHFETDFRSVYARVIDNWLGGDSVGVLGGNFRKPGLDFV